MTGIVMASAVPADGSTQSRSFYNDQLLQHREHVATEDTMEMTAKGCALTASGTDVFSGAVTFSGCIENVLKLSPSLEQDERCHEQGSRSAG
ncbi:hypothetical protein [Ensifer sp. LCM 4579]|uniref:hypothetical protein n=1 Tax=Ensifer sp. LCM 4579 TaxID=1848292 RepID=UPI001041CE8E|nr:hypothetical protein [Ensifer sp. LCM 4579]